MAACLTFHYGSDPAPTGAFVAHVPAVAPYEPGSFYKRELPCLLAVLSQAPALTAVIIDGYVWLGPERRPGLGAYLYNALEQGAAVIGVAKTAFADTPATAVVRGDSLRPLWVAAAGLDEEQAAQHVRSLYGAFRIPALLKQVDGLCRRSWPRAPAARVQRSQASRKQETTSEERIYHRAS